MQNTWHVGAGTNTNAPEVEATKEELKLYCDEAVWDAVSNSCTNWKCYVVITLEGVVCGGTNLDADVS